MKEELSNMFKSNFILPEKRDKITKLYLVKDRKNGGVVYKCKSITSLAKWCYQVEQALELRAKIDSQNKGD